MLEMEILMDLCVLKPLESENHIFSDWFMCLYVCVCVCVSFISITQKQIAVEISNLVFYICITRRCSSNLFMKIGIKLYIQRQTKELQYSCNPQYKNYETNYYFIHLVYEKEIDEFVFHMLIRRLSKLMRRTT